MALPNKEEQALIEKFRGIVADVLTEEDAADDMFLVKWLRARDLNMDKAEEMLRNAAKWRKENKLDDPIIRNKPVNPFYAENFPKSIDGMDKEGRPVVIMMFGCWDVRKVVKEGKSHEFIAYLTSCFEELVSALKQSSRMHPPPIGKPPITQHISIVDWKGFAWGQLLSYQSVQNFLQIGAIYEAYYPETLHRCFFINCPTLISTVLGLLRPVIAAKTMDKITCFGTDKEAWSKEILELIDPDQLRPQFGGTKNNDHNPFL